MTIDPKITNHKIGIVVESNGDFTYSPALKHVEEGDTVQWHCDNAPFAIVIKGSSPFVDGVETRANAGELSEPLEVRPNARGTYHYAVAVYFDSKVWLDASCPSLVVN